MITKLKNAESWWNEYKKMKDDAAENFSKIRRYDSILTKIAELTKKAEREIAIDPSEIPVLPNQGIQALEGPAAPQVTGASTSSRSYGVELRNPCRLHCLQGWRKWRSQSCLQA
ncbi:hypothetical protein L596_024308 [Steinernema carpocapsae]|uniref:Uncharacterized protein n=1 Tax=Steinernema carpocapsae TaxID=34508 RepID=A0A4U5MGD9_STECR|nr:hypothetical protein L596_024308 [Steinernema carpocapsae]